MASGYSAKRFEENRGNRKLCHLNPFEFFDQAGCRILRVLGSLDSGLALEYGNRKIPNDVR